MEDAYVFLERCNRLMMNQSPADILVKAYGRISDCSRWAQRAQAVDEQGRIVRPDDPSAVAWDVQGAIALACNPYGILPPFFMKLMDDLAKEYSGTCSIGEFNDSYRHAYVMQLLREAIRRCRESGA